jgi:hypothetical protein
MLYIAVFSVDTEAPSLPAPTGPLRAGPEVFMVESSTSARFVAVRPARVDGATAGNGAAAGLSGPDVSNRAAGGTEGLGVSAADVALIAGAMRTCVIAEVGRVSRSPLSPLNYGVAS